MGALSRSVVLSSNGLKGGPQGPPKDTQIQSSHSYKYETPEEKL